MGIRELARHLNVSIGTVSRALNGRSDVSAETRRRVLEAAEKLKYAPNQSGRSLRKGTTHAIAFVFQPHPGEHQHGEPFFVPFLRGLQAGFAERNLELIAVVDEPGGSQERLRRIVEARWADAVILAWTRRVDPRIEYLSNVGFPFATLGRSNSGGRNYPSIDLDFVDAAERSVKRLASLGHRRIGVISPSPELNFAYLFRQGYRNALKQHALPFDAGLVRVCEVNEGGGYAATRALLEAPNPPTAVLYNNDSIALGGCRALRDLGLTPGTDVSVLVTVSTPFCGYLSPALSGFAIKLEPLGRRLSDMMLKAMPAYADENGPKILREVWPLDDAPGETDLPVALPKLVKRA